MAGVESLTMATAVRCALPHPGMRYCTYWARYFTLRVGYFTGKWYETR
ncbi:hypothetical protein GCM10018780_19780 [Streptomyces lanatus]|nr:hypothetical protein GCM10018780_19780 [Streptomyces lanatus]